MMTFSRYGTFFLAMSMMLTTQLRAAEPVYAVVDTHAKASAAYHPDRLLVILRHDKQSDRVSTAQAATEPSQRSLLQQAEHFEHLPRQVIVHRPNGQSLEQTMQALMDLPEVLQVERDYRVRKTQQPNDPLYDEQWHLQALPGIQAEQAWQQTTGDPNVVVAVIDTGIDYNHPDLQDNIWRNPLEQDNGQDDSGNGYIDDIRGIDTANNTSDPMDDDGHGTLIAGLIAAAGNNSQGVAGVNWQLQLLPCKFLDDEGDGFTSDAIECLDYVLDLKVNHAIPIVASNNSWGSAQFSQSLYQAVQAHYDAGILFVASAGNSGNAIPFYPAAFDLPNVISVTAHDQQGQRAGFANYGRQHVAISAPGVQMLSTFLGNQYATSSGTSMAGPVVAGLAALIKAAQPAADMQRIKSSILVGASAATDPLVRDYTMSGNLTLAADGDSGGAMNCQDQQLLRRLAPETDIVYAEAGSWIDVKAMAINCDGAIALPAITVSDSMEILQLNDDGQAEDAHAGDGIYTGRWFFSGTAAELNFPDGAVQVEVRRPEYCSEMNVTEVSEQQCDALVELYYQTTGPGWFERSGWLQNNMPCSWFGVQCQGSQVTAIELADNNLTGSIPASFVQLSALQRLDLSGNGLTGSLPSDIHQLQSLQRLDLASNALSGSLPAAVSELTALQWLDLSDNFLQGELPSRLTDLSSLNYFDYRDTDLCEPRNAEYYQWLQAIPNLWVNDDCPNQAPQVSAGSARTVAAGSQVTLQGTASDADGERLSFQWLQFSGPTVALTAADTLQPSFTSPSPSQTVTLSFRVRASDLRSSSEDTVSITVQAVPPPDASSGGAALWLWLVCLLILIGRVLADRVYSPTKFKHDVPVTLKM
ncbi:S8 family serine peptidase [Alkalimonas collagenimarina]|uniref:S8 family serine peptidase n=1 Tax=Alkalimonas collagenimarina TaxID=400390 RepID=A0ABT9H091_9GAMM|nr:S8 family serine peptidase [Alkalimonas collagenimarina]MDP4536618.1 S8 family serine peptidase [Alkalimonas collagenimarina]